MKLLRAARLLLLAFAVTLIPALSYAGVFISVRFGPPALPVYVQPPCPEAGLIWTPGYWAYDYNAGDYYWVPGAWVEPPYAGALWTPGYWGWSDSLYVWHPGYWGQTVGYYGGINYGFGYFGIGFVGGRWHGGYFEYNTAVWRVDTRVIHRTYDDRRDFDRHYVNRDSHVAFSGGPGGIHHAPDRTELAAEHERHLARTSFQTQHMDAARNNRDAFYHSNHGRPQNLVTDRPVGRNFQPNSGARPANQPQHENGGRAQFNEGNHNQPTPQQRPQPEYRPAQPQHNQPQIHTQPQQRNEQQFHQQQQRPQPEYRQAPQQQHNQQQFRTQPERRVEPQPHAQPQQRSEPRGHEQARPQHENQSHEDHGHDNGHR
jgi:WXXGXW repeat (2 copies)